MSTLTQGPGTAAARKRGLDQATREYQDFKLRLAAQRAAQGAPERVEQARERIAGARGQRELDATFTDVARSLRR